MGRLIVAVKSCHRDRDAGFHDAIRGTWGKDLKARGVDVRFFVGQTGDNRRDPLLKSDETMVDAPDDYMNLPFKTRRACQWIVGKIYDNAFFCDNDTYVDVPLLLQLPYEGSDFAGHFCRGPAETTSRFDYRDHMGFYPQSYPWCSGGIGYFLSRRAIDLVADTPPMVWAEDMYVGQVIGPEVHENDWTVTHLLMNGFATSHFRKSTKFTQFTPELLYRAYQEKGFQGIYGEAAQFAKERK